MPSTSAIEDRERIPRAYRVEGATRLSASRHEEHNHLVYLASATLCPRGLAVLKHSLLDCAEGKVVCPLRWHSHGPSHHMDHPQLVASSARPFPWRTIPQLAGTILGGHRRPLNRSELGKRPEASQTRSKFSQKT